MRWFLYAIVLLALVSAASADNAIYRLNSGGPAFTDFFGNDWRSDSGFFVNGWEYSTPSPINKSELDLLYQTERFAPPGENELAYHLPLLNGKYTVVLHFAEIWTSQYSERRVFSVESEGAIVGKNIEIAQKVGLKKPYLLVFDSNVSDGSLDIVFHRVSQNPKLSGIEVFAISGLPALAPSEVALNFNPVIGNNDTKRLMLRNLGERPLLITNISAKGSQDFQVLAEPPYTIPPSSGIVIDTSFAARTLGAKSAYITIASNDPASPHAIFLMGNAQASGNLLPGLIAKFYSVSDGIYSLPDLDQINASFMTITTTPHIEPTQGPADPSVYNDSFAATYEGLLRTEDEGMYEFILTSDDGSRLFIDDKQVVDNDGLHSMRPARQPVYLSAGDHPIKVEYFEGRLTAGLQLEVVPPEGRRTLAGPELFYHDASLELPFINSVEEPSVGVVTVRGLGFDHQDDQISATVNGFPAVVKKQDSQTLSITLPQDVEVVCIRVRTPLGESAEFIFVRRKQN